MQNQISDTVLMIRPASSFEDNETAETNKYQRAVQGLTPKQLLEIALLEFDNFVDQLTQAHVNVLVEDDTVHPKTSGAIFPNNWITTHSDGKIITYPMLHESRKPEVRLDIVERLKKQFGYKEWIRLDKYASDSKARDKGLALEGTGSIVFDHKNKVAYAATSPRTNPSILKELGEIINYDIEIFKALGAKGEPIYHTNVMMCIADEYVIIGLDVIPDKQERNQVFNRLKSTGREIIPISNDQLHQNFAGNMLQVRNKKGEKILIMSSSAYKSLSSFQIELIETKYKNKIIAMPINTVEVIGGGSARCMLAEIFVPD